MLRLRMKTVAGVSLGEKVIDQFPILVGRDSACGLVLTESGISSKHAELDWDGYYITVRDVGSRNGTFVGSKEKVGNTRLQPPCSITLGNVVVIDFEAVQSAVAMRPVARPASTLPKPMKRPEPPAPVVQPDPVPAVVEIQEAEIIEGWELYWHMVKKQAPRPVLLAMMGLAGLYSILHMLIFRDEFLFSFGVGFGTAVGCALVAVIMAGILAVPGVLFRGKYDFKPLFVQWCLGMMVYSFYAGLMRPVFLMEYISYVAQAFSLPILLVCSVTGSYMLIFNTFSHKHEKKLVVVAALVGLLFTVGMCTEVFKVDRQDLMREALMGKYRTARGLAGSATDVKSVTDEIRDFGRKYPAK